MLRIRPGFLPVAGAILALAVAGATPASAQQRHESDFETGTDGWVLRGTHSIEVRDSGDPAHGKVLELRSNGNGVLALIRGSHDWGVTRVEADFFFPTGDPSYLGFVYGFSSNAERSDYGQIYIKGDGSYLRANPVRDGNVSRLLYEEYRTALTGPSAVEPGKWQRLRAEVDRNVCHLYVGDTARPNVTFDLFERAGGLLGFVPRVVGAPVWIDNVRVTTIEHLTYDGPPIPDITYRAEELLTAWETLGPLASPAPEIETDAGVDGVERGGRTYAWRPHATDRRGAVVTGSVTEYDGDESVAYFRTRIHARTDTDAILHLSTTDELALFLNGIFQGFVYRDGYVSGDNDWNAWYDFWSNPQHAGRRTRIRLKAGDNAIVLRVRNGQFASGGFFARLETEAGERIELRGPETRRRGRQRAPGPAAAVSGRLHGRRGHRLRRQLGGKIWRVPVGIAGARVVR